MVGYRQVVNQGNLMKLPLSIAILLACITGCTVDDRTANYAVGRSSMPLRAADFQHCPEGHHALAEIPITGGLIDTPEMRRQIENLEVWPEGCCPSGNYKIVCKECGLAYSWWTGKWERRLSWTGINLKLPARN